MFHFDILLITYNRPILLQHTLKSLSLQTFKNFTVYLVDNGSDPPVDINIFPKDLYIVFKRYDTNQHGCDVGNEALKGMQGTHFSSLADDDVWVPSTLEIVAKVFSGNAEIESLGVGLSHFNHDSCKTTSDNHYFNTFTGNLERFEAFQMGLAYCVSWGIGQFVQYRLPRMAHSSAAFFSHKLINRTVAKQKELFVKPFGDVGFVGCYFNQNTCFYLDLPLAAIGRTKKTKTRGFQAGNRMHWMREVPFIEHSPLKACSFVNMSAEGHLKVLYRNEINRIWECSLTPAFYLRHLEQVASDDPWTEETQRDINEALPYAVEGFMKQCGRTDEKTRTALRQNILDHLKKYALQIKEKNNESGKAEQDNTSEYGTFSDIVDFALWQEKNFVVPKQKDYIASDVNKMDFRTDMPMYFSTVSDDKHYPMLLNLIGCLHRLHFDDIAEISVYDLGLTEQQKQELLCIEKVALCEIEKTNPYIFDLIETGPNRIVRGLFSWKPVVIRQSLDKYPYVLYVDAGTTILRSITGLFKHITQNGYFLTDCGHSIRWMATKTVIDRLRVEPEI